MNAIDVCRLFEDPSVKINEREVDKLLTELREELDIANANGKPFKSISSLSMPKTTEYYRSELRSAVLQSLNVSEFGNTKNMAEVFQDEFMAASRAEHTLENLPLILLQFYLQQIHVLVYSKRSYLLRWQQFARHTKAMEASYPRFQERVMQVMNNWRSTLERCERLSSLHELFITSQQAGPQTPQATFGALSHVQVEDVLIYLRWLITNSAQMRLSQKFFTVCQWVPQLYTNEIERAVKTENVAEGVSYYTEVFKGRRSSGMKPTFMTEIPGAVKPNLARTHLSASNAGLSLWGPLSRIKQSTLPFVTDNVSASKHLLQYLTDVYAIPLDKEIDQLMTVADYAELFVAVDANFTKLFQDQEESNTFKVFDSVDASWSADSPNRAFLVKANWQEFVHFKPELDSNYETLLTYLRNETLPDELLQLQNSFLEQRSTETVCNTYKSYLRQVSSSNYMPRAARVLSNKTDANTLSLWRRVEMNSENSANNGNRPVEIWDLDDNKLENFERSKQTSKEKPREMEVPTTTLLQLEKPESDGADPGNLCVMLLRHLRIRDHQRSILSVLNYFRSVERTIAIDTCGLVSEEETLLVEPGTEAPPPRMKPTSFSPRQAALSLGLEAASVGLGQPHYVYNTPKDFAASEAEFMELDDVANHCNFYVHKEGRIHVKDEKGCYIMYDVAKDDLKRLQADMLLLASRVVTKAYNAPTLSTPSTPNDDILRYSNASIDRLGVWYDFWTLEAEFQELKRELFDLYYEAYLNAFNRDVRYQLIQILVNIQHRRPRFSTNDGSSSPASYIQIYRLECECLRKTSKLVREVLKGHITHCRDFISKLRFSSDAEKVGMPFPVTLKQPITAHLPKTAITTVDLLEFHESTASVAQHLPGIVEFVSDEFSRLVKTGSNALQRLRAELFAVECLLKEWFDQKSHGSTFSHKIQTEVLFEALADDPVYMTEISKAKLGSLESEMMGLTRNDQASKIYSALCRVLDIVSYRQRLIVALYESEVLAKVYKQLSRPLGFEPYHLCIRCLHLENAIKRDQPSFIVQVPQPNASDEDFQASGLDKFISSAMPMAVQEVDENHMPHFSFRQPASMKSLLTDEHFRKLQATLTCQIAHKNLLTAAVQLMYYVKDHLPVPRGAPEMPVVTAKKSGDAVSDITRKDSIASQVSQPSVYKPPDSLPECFVSMQLEKMTKRTFAHNWFVDGKIQLGVAARKPSEFEKLIANTVTEFSHMVTLRASIIGLKGQLIAYYTDILTILQEFPSIRDNFFQMGYYKEVKNRNELTRDYLIVDPLAFKQRPRTFLTPDGKTFMNLWFIPFPSEIVQSYLTLPDEEAVPIFSVWLRIVACLHDILLLLAAFAKMGVRLGHGTVPSERYNVAPAAATSSAEWGGAEGIGAELFEIQSQISSLNDPSDPELVADFLEIRRGVAFLSLDVTLRHLMRDALFPKREAAYQGLLDGIYHNLPILLGSTVRTVPTSLQGNLVMPQSIESREKLAKTRYLYRYLINRNGPFLTGTARFHKIISLVHGCFCRLSKTDRQTLNGELMSLTLMTEELMGHANNSYARLLLGRETEEDPFDVRSIGGAASPHPTLGSRPSSSSSTVRAQALTIGTNIHAIPNTKQSEFMTEPPISKLKQPMVAYRLVSIYLRLWKQMEVFKQFLMKNRVNIEDLRTEWNAETYELALSIYSTERYTPLLINAYNIFGTTELSLMLNFAKSSREVLALPLPAALSDLDMKAVQLAQLVQHVICMGFEQITKKLQRDSNILLNEKAREEDDALPTDLWKKPGIQENFTFAQPQLVEHFFSELYGGIVERKDGLVVFSSDSLNRALNNLASGSMAREKFCFESYSSYYETLLRQYHRELYAREREIEALETQVSSFKEDINTMAMERMAMLCRDLLLEVTSLRLRIRDADQEQAKSKQDIRSSVKSEFAGLVDALAGASLQLRSRFEGYRHRIAGETDELIKETKDQVLRELRKMHGKGGDQSPSQDTTNDNDRSGLEAEIENLREQKRVHEALLAKTRIVDAWKLNVAEAKLKRKIEELEMEIDEIKRNNCDSRLLSNEEVLLLRQQQVTLRKAVSMAERETARVRNQLEKEARTRQEREQSLKEQMAAQEKSHQARTSTFEQVDYSDDDIDLYDRDDADSAVTDLAERNVVVRQMAFEMDTRDRTTSFERHNASRDLKSARSQLLRERDLKQQAIGRLGDLARVVGDMETIIADQQQWSPIQGGFDSAQSSRPTTSTVRQLSSAMAAQFAASKPPSRQLTTEKTVSEKQPFFGQGVVFQMGSNSELDVRTENSSIPKRSGLRPTTAAGGITRGRRPQTAASAASISTSSVLPKSSNSPSKPIVTATPKARAKSARLDVVRFNILSDLEPPTFDQIRQMTRSTSITKVDASDAFE